MRKFPLQLLILLVVRNSIDRSTESSGKPGSKQGKEQSEELGNTELGLWEPPGRRRGHTQVRRSRERLEELWVVPSQAALRARTLRDGETQQRSNLAQGNTHQRKAPLQIPSGAN